MTVGCSGQYDSAQRAWVDLGSSSAIRAIRVWRRKASLRWPRPRPIGGGRRQAQLDIGLSETRGLPGARVEGRSIALQYALFRRDTVAAFPLRGRLSSSVRSTPSPLDRPLRAIAWFTRYGQPPRHADPYRDTRRRARRFRRGNSGWYRATGWLALAEKPSDGRGRRLCARQICPPAVRLRSLGGRHRIRTGQSTGLGRCRLTQMRLALAPGRQVADPWGLAPSLKRLGELSEERAIRHARSTITPGS
jgi:hypothetical protein